MKRFASPVGLHEIICYGYHLKVKEDLLRAGRAKKASEWLWATSPVVAADCLQAALADFSGLGLSPTVYVER